MALFLRYCAPCNTTQPIAERGAKGLKCGGCGGTLKIVDAFALIPALGSWLTTADRRLVIDSLEGHDLPRG